METNNPDDKRLKLDKILSKHDIRLIYDESSEDNQFQCSISPWFDFKFVSIPLIFDIQNEIHLITVFHEIGHLLISKHFKKFIKTSSYASNGKFISSMKDEIRAWKIGIKLYKETYDVPINEDCFSYIVDCLMTYYNYFVNKRLRDNLLPICKNPELRLRAMFK